MHRLSITMNILLENAWVHLGDHAQCVPRIDQMTHIHVGLITSEAMWLGPTPILYFLNFSAQFSLMYSSHRSNRQRAWCRVPPLSDHRCPTSPVLLTTIDALRLLYPHLFSTGGEASEGRRSCRLPWVAVL
jgi:hypothetical protein